LRQSLQRLRRHKIEGLFGVRRRITPFVLGHDRKAERLAGDCERRQDGLPACGRSGDQIEARLHRQFAELVGRERVDRRLELDIRFDIRLQTEARRSLSAIAQANRQRIAAAQIAAADADEQGIRIGTNVQPVEPDLELRAVAGFDSREVGRLRLVELRFAHVRRGPP
jgi:hypothetical protein